MLNRLPLSPLRSVKRKTKTALTATLLVLAALAITTIVCWLSYVHTIDVLTGELRQRLIAIARTAAVQFDTDDLALLQVEQDWQTPQWARVVHQLEKVRTNNDRVLFAYIVRKQRDDPSRIEFVADSHSLNPYAEIDLNGDGRIDAADQLQWPGQDYPDAPEEIVMAYEQPITSRELIVDQWGVELVGYAPIKDAQQQTVAVMAVDMNAADFFTITRQTFVPFALLVIFLFVLIISLVWTLVSLWNRQAESLEEIDRQKDELLSLVGHQLNSPLASLRQSLSDFLAGDFGPMSDEQKEHLNNDVVTTRGLSDLVALLLEASRIELGKMRTKKDVQSLKQFFGNIITFTEQLARDKGVHFLHSVPDDLPDGNFDARLSRMTIENLLTNAIKYTPKDGSVTLQVRLEGRTLHCTVQDTGMGIPLEDQKNLFTKGFRAGNTRNIEGNGLGLFVARSAILQQGGTLTFHSEVGKGTTFLVTLPV